MKVVVDLGFIVGYEIRIDNRQVICTDTLGMVGEFNALLGGGVSRVHHHRNATSALVNYNLGSTFALLCRERPELAHEVATIDAVQQLVVDAVTNVAPQSLLVEFIGGRKRIGDGAPDGAEVGTRIGFGF